MALTKAQKTAQLTELKEKMSKAESIMFAHYIGLTVGKVSDLRGQLRKGDAEMKVAKKTLMKIAAKENGLPEITDDLFDGPVACIFSFKDPLSGAQIAFKFAKENKQVELIGGIFEGKLLNKEQATVLAKIPGRQQLLAIFVGMCNGPLTGFARALAEIAKQKEAPAPVEAPKVEAAASTTADKPAPVETPAPETASTTADKPAVEATTPAPEASATADTDAPTSPEAPAPDAPAA